MIDNEVTRRLFHAALEQPTLAARSGTRDAHRSHGNVGVMEKTPVRASCVGAPKSGAPPADGQQCRGVPSHLTHSRYLNRLVVPSTRAMATK